MERTRTSRGGARHSWAPGVGNMAPNSDCKGGAIQAACGRAELGIQKKSAAPLSAMGRISGSGAARADANPAGSATLASSPPESMAGRRRRESCGSGTSKADSGQLLRGPPFRHRSLVVPQSRFPGASPRHKTLRILFSSRNNARSSCVWLCACVCFKKRADQDLWRSERVLNSFTPGSRRACSALGDKASHR